MGDRNRRWQRALRGHGFEGDPVWPTAPSAGQGRFLLLGSASIDRLKQSSESLAGRIRYLELTPVHAGEAGAAGLDALWLRGGFPESLLADTG